MTFAWPDFLWLLLVPLALAVVELSRRRGAAKALEHPKILRAEVGPDSLALARGRTGTSLRFRPWLTAGLALAIVALARPQWGRVEEAMFDQSREILIAVDLSRSMLSPDVKPSRLERSKLLIQSLLEKLKGERVGLVVFSGTAFLQSPLSSDYEILREFLPALGPDYLPEGGTNYRAMLDTALEAFGSSNAADRFLIVLSDGEATDDDWKSGAEKLEQRGIHVLALGVGTAAGTMIPDGSGGFVKDDRGAVVLSKLESGTLQELATMTHGAYRDASVWIDLASLIDQTVNQGRKGNFVDKTSVRRIERFQWPLALAVWCLLVSFYYEFPVRPRPRAITLRGEPPPGPPAGGPTPTIAAGLLVALLCLVPSRSHAAVKVAPLPSTAPAPATSASAAPTPAENSAALLGKMVNRLSSKDTLTAPDLSDFAHETLKWGRQLKDAGQPVPEGPVHDALEAVDRLKATGAKLSDWNQLQQELESLLKKPPPPPKPPPQSQNKNAQDQKDSPQNKQDQAQQNPSSSNGSKSSSGDQKQSESQDRKQSDAQKDEAQKSAQQKQSAFGDMKPADQKPPPPQPSSDTQRVGGVAEKKDAQPPTDPTLALPLERLEQLKNQDSPAQLFEMLQGDRSQVRQKPKKDW